MAQCILVPNRKPFHVETWMKEHALSLLTPGLVALACHPTLLGGRVGWRGMFRFALMEPGVPSAPLLQKKLTGNGAPLSTLFFIFIIFKVELL